jgi:hypothetical protein
MDVPTAERNAQAGEIETPVGPVPLGDLRWGHGQFGRMDSRPYLDLRHSSFSHPTVGMVDVVTQAADSSMDFVVRNWRVCRWCWALLFVSLGALMMATVEHRVPTALEVGSVVWRWATGG